MRGNGTDVLKSSPCPGLSARRAAWLTCFCTLSVLHVGKTSLMPPSYWLKGGSLTSLLAVQKPTSLGHTTPHLDKRTVSKDSLAVFIGQDMAITDRLPRKDAGRDGRLTFPIDEAARKCTFRKCTLGSNRPNLPP